MVGLYILFLYFAGLTVLALMVLTFFPPLRLTLGNLLLFVIGGFVGMVALDNLVLRSVFYLIHFSSQYDVLAYPIGLVGATLGGVGSVRLKMRLARKTGKSQTS